MNKQLTKILVLTIFSLMVFLAVLLDSTLAIDEDDPTASISPVNGSIVLPTAEIVIKVMDDVGVDLGDTTYTVEKDNTDITSDLDCVTAYDGTTEGTITCSKSGGLDQGSYKVSVTPEDLVGKVGSEVTSLFIVSTYVPTTTTSILPTTTTVPTTIILKEGDVLNYEFPGYTKKDIPDMFSITIGYYPTDYDVSFDFIINDDGISSYNTNVQGRNNPSIPNTHIATFRYKTLSCPFTYGEYEVLTDLEFNKLLDGVTGQIMVNGGAIFIKYILCIWGAGATENSFFIMFGAYIEDYIITGKVLKADFKVNSTTGNPPLTINFKDNSTGAILAYSWDFGDGNISNKKNPSNTYTQDGNYTVSLTLTGMETIDTETKVDYIHVSGTTTTTIPQPVPTTTTSVNICAVQRIYGVHAEETESLRYFRDNVLSKTQEGREIIRLYYKWSPVVVKAMEEDEEFMEEVKEMINSVLELIGGKME